MPMIAASGQIRGLASLASEAERIEAFPVPVDPEVYQRDTWLYTDSVNVAAFTRKQHGHVLRDIDAMISTSPNLGRLYFIELRQPHDKDARVSRYYEMTRDGMTMLVMRYTGPKAVAFQMA